MEIADTLYGASMGKEGITELYSVRISQLNEKGKYMQDKWDRGFLKTKRTLETASRNFYGHD
jgi:hypothetical protein